MDKKPKGALKMRNIPTDIYIENEAVKNHGGEIAELGKKAMIVTGRHSSAVNGSLDDVKAVLESQGIGYVIYMILRKIRLWKLFTQRQRRR